MGKTGAIKIFFGMSENFRGLILGGVSIVETYVGKFPEYAFRKFEKFLVDRNGVPNKVYS